MNKEDIELPGSKYGLPDMGVWRILHRAHADALANNAGFSTGKERITATDEIYSDLVRRGFLS